LTLLRYYILIIYVNFDYPQPNTSVIDMYSYLAAEFLFPDLKHKKK